MKKIALFMDEWKRCFTYAWPSGILQRIRETNAEVSLYIFSSSGNWSLDNKFNYGEYNIYRLPHLQDFDGIILDLNNVELQDVREDIIRRVKESGVPAVSIGDDIEDFYCVGIDNNNAMRKIIAHMYQQHKCRKFWFIMGKRDHYDCKKRFEALMDYVKEKDLDITERECYFGSFECSSGEEGFYKLFEEHHGELPDAIICANDNLAVGVSEAVMKSGYTIPGDVKITGFDNLDKANIYKPNISTASFIREEIGIRIVDLFLQIWKGEKPERFTYSKTQPIFWESCGCNYKAQIDIRGKLKENMLYEVETMDFEGTMLELEYELQICKNIPQIMNCISRFVSAFKCDALYLVMDKNIHAYRDQVTFDFEQDRTEENFEKIGYPAEMQLMFAYENGHIIDTSDMKTNGIFPLFDSEKSGTDFLFLPLYFKEYAVGYFVIRNAVYLLEKQYLFQVMSILRNAIENLYAQERLEYMNNMLARLYVHDALTGLYNRFGFQQLGNQFFERQKKKGEPIFIMFIDLDHLKKINDKFGHEKGDFAICSVAKAIRKYCDPECIACRTGGDEFVVIQKQMLTQVQNQLKINIQQELKQIEKETDFPYALEVSIGEVLTDPDSDLGFEDYVRLADEKMYQEKVNRRANRE